MKKRIQSITLILGSLLAVAIICAQLFQFQSASSYASKKDIKTEQQQNEQSNSEESVITLPSFSLPTSVHVSLTQEAHYLFEILFEDVPEKTSNTEAPAFPEKLFNTLFRVIISPNAP